MYICIFIEIPETEWRGKRSLARREAASPMRMRMRAPLSTYGSLAVNLTGVYLNLRSATRPKPCTARYNVWPYEYALDTVRGLCRVRCRAYVRLYARERALCWRVCPRSLCWHTRATIRFTRCTLHLCVCVCCVCVILLAIGVRAPVSVCKKLDMRYVAIITSTLVSTT